jgi:Putative prokaryotic signal transducing protein
MAEKIDWVKVQEYASRFDAELARARLESARIPAMIASHGGGIFGAGFQGTVPGGVDLKVPRELVAEVKEILRGD